MRSLFLLPGLLLGVLLASQLLPAAMPPGPPVIRATPVDLDRGDPARSRLGRLRYLGGWELQSDDPRFGGLSAMIWRNGHLLALSDAGAVFDIAVTGGTPTGMVRGVLPAGPGTGRKKSDRDAESLATDPANERLWVGFEGHNAIWRYDAGFVRAEAQARPAAMREWPGNGGPEAMVRLADGRFLVFSEQARGPDGSTALLVFASDPTRPGTTSRLAGYRAPAGYAVTDAALLPDGRLILLHRRFTLMEGVAAVIGILDPAKIRPGHAAAATEIARLAPSLTVDNMEAIAVAREGGRTILWIASDDNFSPLQQTLLLKFVLPS